MQRNENEAYIKMNNHLMERKLGGISNEFECIKCGNTFCLSAAGVHGDFIFPTNIDFKQDITFAYQVNKDFCHLTDNDFKLKELLR